MGIDNDGLGRRNFKGLVDYSLVDLTRQLSQWWQVIKMAAALQTAALGLSDRGCAALWPAALGRAKLRTAARLSVALQKIRGSIQETPFTQHLFHNKHSV